MANFSSFRPDLRTATFTLRPLVPKESLRRNTATRSTLMLLLLLLLHSTLRAHTQTMASHAPCKDKLDIRGHSKDSRLLIPLRPGRRDNLGRMTCPTISSACLYKTQSRLRNPKAPPSRLTMPSRSMSRSKGGLRRRRYPLSRITKLSINSFNRNISRCKIQPPLLHTHLGHRILPALETCTIRISRTRMVNYPARLSLDDPQAMQSTLCLEATRVSTSTHKARASFRRRPMEATLRRKARPLRATLLVASPPLVNCFSVRTPTATPNQAPLSVRLTITIRLFTRRCRIVQRPS